MKWSKNELLNSPNETVHFDEQITFGEEVFSKMHHLRGLRDIEVSGEIHYDTHSDLATCDFEVEGVMIVPCSITNEDVDYPFACDAHQLFAFHKVSKDEDIIETKGDIVELMPTIFQTIILEVPLKVVKEGIKEYPKGKGWEVIREEDYTQKKKDEIDPRLAKLREFKVEE
ncbi:MAG: DUF177 domain-containing protein [Erysipelotrichia bacterium]|nr:DUF177 domain-containing protein [Erysipelotrichia bacterium]NCC53952.1 DUF177 domain-containing protein [Erysipelotrichia bacterium]